MKRLAFVLLASCTLLASPRAQEAPQANAIEVEVRRVRGGDRAMFALQAGGLLTASPQRVWQVLTDYGRLHEFVPNLLSSKIVSRNGNETVIEQTGTAGFLFVQRTIHIVVRTVEYPISRIDVDLISGDMKHYAVRWEMLPATVDGAAGTRLVYTGTLEPDFFVPPLFGSGIVQADVKTMMQALVAEILKSP